MSNPVWPAELPQISNREGFGYALGDARRQGRNGAGGLNTGRRLSLVADAVTLVFDMDQDQVDFLFKFWRDDLRGGTEPFVIRDQLRDGGLLLDPDGVPLLDPGGRPLLVDAWWLCRMGQEPPRVTIPFGVTRAVPVPLWILP